MTKETLTQDHFSKTKKISDKKLMQHEQFCLGVLGVAQNGASEQELLPLIERMHAQADSLLHCN